MVKIRQDKFDAFNKMMEASYIDRMAEYVREAYPEIAFERSSPEEMRGYIGGLVREAGTFGLTNERTVARYIDYRAELGALLTNDPEFEWAMDILRNPHIDEEEKVQRIDMTLFGGPVLRHPREL